MNFLILGSGAEERSWAGRIGEDAEHRLWAAFPGFEEWADVPKARDLDDALATAGVEAVVIGGEAEFRAEALRRVAAVGLPAICLHPPGPDSEAYYQVALSRARDGGRAGARPPAPPASGGRGTSPGDARGGASGPSAPSGTSRPRMERRGT